LQICCHASRITEIRHARACRRRRTERRITSMATRVSFDGIDPMPAPGLS
jgi:hypothetical protein